MKKIVNYLPFFVLFFLPLLFYPGVETSGWRSSSDVHALLEFASSLLAITAGIMVLLHFFTTGRWFFLIISIGFVLIGAEEFVHAIFSFSFNRIWSETPSPFRLAISTTWLTGHFILLTSFFIALIFGKKEIVPAKRVLNAVVYNIIGLIFAASVALLIFNSPFIPDFVQLGSITKKLIELSLALLYFVAFLFYSNIYVKQQSHSPLLWSIIACIIFRVLAHIFVFDAQAFYDSHWDTAHLIVFLSYFFPIFGVWGETIKLNRSSQVQVIELAKEITERKQAEEELRESEKYFKEITENASDIIIITDKNGDIRYCSRSIERFTGYKSEELIGRSGFTFIHPDDVERAVGDFGKAILTIDSAIPNAFRMVHKDGSERYCDGLGKNLLDNPAVAGFIMNIRDITERKRAEEALRQREENFRTSLDDSPMGVRIVTAEGETIYANRAILDIYGYDSMEDLKTTPVEKRYTPESHADFLSRRTKRQQGVDVPSEYTINIIRKDGEVRHLLVLRREVLWDGERQFQVLYNDITDRRRAEVALRESEELYRSLFENMLNGFAYCKMLFDKEHAQDFVYLEVNNAFEKLTGLKDVIGKKATELIPGIREKDPGLFETYGRVALTGKPVTLEIYLESLGVWHYVSVYSPRKEYFVSVFDVITERKRAEEELRTSRLQLRALATRLQTIREEERIMISREIHDEMGGGLTGLKMGLSWMLRKMGDADPGEERVALMDKIHTSNALIDQMIHVVRRISTDLRPSVLDDLGLIAALEWQLSEFTSRTEILHEFATTVEYVNVEEDTAVAVFRIFQEALTNVIRHSQATKVAVVLREGERSLFGDESFILEIRDNGRGITEEEILNPESLGLLGMKERVLTFGGELSIRAESGGGTALVLQIPQHKIPSLQA
jgi:PAS domain S-box-containing protein